jgi:hypothetical protein
MLRALLFIVFDQCVVMAQVVTSNVHVIVNVYVVFGKRYCVFE